MRVSAQVELRAVADGGRNVILILQPPTFDGMVSDDNHQVRIRLRQIPQLFLRHY
jgi:hypothetical protein